MADFLRYAQWVGIATLVFGVLTLVGFLFQWGIRFRLVGITGFMAVLTGGLLTLGVIPFTRTLIPGAVRYVTTYDSGAAQAVIAVVPPVTEDQVTATLQQAASDLFSPGRLSRGESKLTIQLRTILHTDPGISQPLPLGQVRRSLFDREDKEMEITVFTDNIAKLPASIPTGSSPADPS